MTDYFFAEAGDDVAGAGTIGDPWQTYEKARVTFNSMIAGDSINLKGGDTFERLTAADNQWIGMNNPTGFDQLHVRNYGTGKAIFLDNNVGGATMELLANQGASALPLGGITVDGIAFESWSNTVTYGIYVVLTSTYTTATNCSFNGFGAGFYCAEFNGYRPNHTRVTFNKFYNARDLGAVAGLSDNYTVTDNEFNNDGYGETSLDHTIYLSGSAELPVTNMNISRNMIRNSNHINGGNNAATIVVHGNVNGLIIEDNGAFEVAGSSWNAGWGIAVDAGYVRLTEDFNDVTIRRNLIDGTGNVGVSVDTATNVLIEDNSIRCNGTQNLTNTFIGVEVLLGSDTKKSDNVTVRNNLIYVDTSKVTGLVTPVSIEAGITTQLEENNLYIPYVAPLKFFVTKPPTKGHFTSLDTLGAFTYVNENAAPDTDSFKYIIEDAIGKSNEATVNLTIESTSLELNFDQTDMRMTIPVQTLGIGDTVSFTYRWDSVTPIVDLAWTGEGITTKGLWSRIDIAAHLDFNTAACTAKVDGVARSQGYTLPTDGLEHTIELTSTIVDATIAVFGDILAASPNSPYRGVLKDISLVISANTTTWAIDSGSITTEAPTIDENAIGAIALNNVIAGDWTSV